MMKTTLASGTERFIVQVELSSRVKNKNTEWFGSGSFEMPTTFNKVRNQNCTLRLGDKTCNINIVSFSPMNGDFTFTVTKFN